MTLKVLESRGSEWSIGQLDLAPGLWVVLVSGGSTADDFARHLIGLARSPTGRILLHGQPVYSSPKARRSCASVLVREPLPTWGTWNEAYGELGGQPRTADLDESLSALGIAQLANHRVQDLDRSQIRQLAFAYCLAHATAELTVIVEPFVDLTLQQSDRVQSQLNERAQRACVICITSSEHDAQRWGGPHAQLNGAGWHWQQPASLDAQPNTWTIEGKALGPVIAFLSQVDWVRRLTSDISTHGEVLSVVVAAHAPDFNQVLRIAQESGAVIRQVHSGEFDDQGPTAPEVTERPSPGMGAPPEPLPAKAMPEAGCVPTAACSARIAKTVAKRLCTPAAIVAVFTSVAFSGGYVAMQARNAAVGAEQHAVEFVLTNGLLAAALLVCALCRPKQLALELEQLSRVGCSRKVIVVSQALGCALTAAVVGAGTASLALLFYPGAFASWVDRVTIGWIGGLGCAVYATLLLILWGKLRHSLTISFAVLDAVLGSKALAISAAFPRAHLLNLSGATTSLLWNQQLSCIFLGLLLTLAIWLRAIRTAR